MARSCLRFATFDGYLLGTARPGPRKPHIPPRRVRDPEYLPNEQNVRSSHEFIGRDSAHSCAAAGHHGLTAGRAQLKCVGGFHRDSWKPGEESVITTPTRTSGPFFESTNPNRFGCAGDELIPEIKGPEYDIRDLREFRTAESNKFFAAHRRRQRYPHGAPRSPMDAAHPRPAADTVGLTWCGEMRQHGRHGRVWWFARTGQCRPRT